MEYVIGIDGGGTKTLLKIADMKGKILLTAEGGASNINSVEKSKVEETINILLNDSVKKIKEVPENCSVICIGSAGVDRPQDKKIMEDIVKKAGFNGFCIATNDAETALYGAVGAEEGLMVISGTGAICYGKNRDGKITRCDGWGHIIGDEGSGFYIGRKALEYVMKSYDGRIKETKLTKAVLSELKLQDPEELINYVYRSGIGKKEIASISRIVGEVQEMDDWAAEEILEDAAEKLFNSASTVMVKLGLQCKNVSIAVNGSVITKNKKFYNEFCKLVRNFNNKADIIPMKNDAASGAILMALGAVK